MLSPEQIDSMVEAVNKPGDMHAAMYSLGLSTNEWIEFAKLAPTIDAQFTTEGGLARAAKRVQKYVTLSGACSEAEFLRRTTENV